MSVPNIPTRILMFRDFVPDRVRVFLCLFFAVTFQFSGGIYLASVSQMVVGVDAGGYHDGGLCFVRGDNDCFSYSFPVEVSFHFPVDFLDGLSGVDCL